MPTHFTKLPCCQMCRPDPGVFTLNRFGTNVSIYTSIKSVSPSYNLSIRIIIEISEIFEHGNQL